MIWDRLRRIKLCEHIFRTRDEPHHNQYKNCHNSTKSVFFHGNLIINFSTQ